MHSPRPQPAGRGTFVFDEHFRTGVVVRYGGHGGLDTFARAPNLAPDGQLARTVEAHQLAAGTGIGCAAARG